MSSWRTKKLLDCCIKITSGGTPSRKESSFYENGTIPWVKTGELGDGKLFDYEISEWITDKAIASSSAKIFPKNTILMAMYGDGKTIGSLGILQQPSACNQACSALISNPKICNSTFLFYALKVWREGMIRLAYGGAQRNLTSKLIQHFKIDVPDLNTQNIIASILSSYDELINYNLQRIKLLEESAYLTYEEWFLFQKIANEKVDEKEIRYDALEDLIKEYRNGGWGIEELGGKHTEPAFVIRGTDMPDINDGNVSNVPLRYHTSKNLSPRKLMVGDISIEMSNGNLGNIGRSCYFDEGIASQLGGSAMCASFCKLLRPKSIELSYIIDVHLKYIHKNNQMLAYKSQGANGINNFRFEDMISEEQIPLPEGKNLEALVTKLSESYILRSNLRQQIQKINEIRDILLPRLMTGMIDVENIKLPKTLLERINQSELGADAA